MDVQSFEALDLKLNDAVILQNPEGDEVKGFYLGEYDTAGRTFGFSNFETGQVETIVIDNLAQMRKE